MRSQRGVRFVLGLALVAVAAASGGPAPSASTAPPASTGPATTAAATSSAAPAPATATPVASSALGTDRPIASTGSIAVLHDDGSLSVVDGRGRAALLADAAEGTYGFPTWSPDGSRIAAVRYGTADAAIVVFDTAGLATGQPADPVVIFRSSTIGPFYLFWTPDGQSVSFLAQDPSEQSLRIAPADGSSALIGDGSGTKVRSGNPFYFDWIERDRLLAHVGGADGFVGEIGLDGVAAGSKLGSPGDFRSAVVSRDHRSIAFVRAGDDASEVIVSDRDGSNEHGTNVFGPAAVVFDPAGGTVATLGAPAPIQTQPGFPIGPVRLIDARTGDVRTLIDGVVVSFWWSPDGRTIAALTVQPAAGSTPSPSPGASPAAPRNEVRLAFVDVASGRIRSQPMVQPAQQFVSSFLPYFDQYALSHRLWAPDSSSMLFPEVLPDGSTRVSVWFPDGEPPIALDGEIAFWSP